MVASGVQHVHVNIDAGELPGILYTKDLIVTYVQRSGALEDRILVGDKILAVNDRTVSDRSAFDQIQQKLTINRDKIRGEKIKQEQQVDDKKITKRYGFLYLKVRLTHPRQTGERLGLALKNGPGKQVWVTGVTHGSSSAECLIVGDRILQIDGTTVDDKETAKRVIIKGLSSSGSIVLIVERPDSSAARNVAAEVMTIRTPPNPDKI